ILTQGNAADAVPGALGQPGTRVLAGQTDLDFNQPNGIRAFLGFWGTCEPTVAFEPSGFLFEKKTVGANFRPDRTASPILVVPVNRIDLGSNSGFALSDPLVGRTGAASFTSSQILWGAEGNVLVNCVRCWGFEADFLTGFKYLDLHEDL